MPTETRTFPLADILSITTGRLLSRSRIEGVYRILNWCTADNLMSHQLPRAGRWCKPHLLHQFPQLAGVEPARDLSEAELWRWLGDAEREYGTELPVAQPDGWERQDPIEELCDMIDPERVSVTTLPEVGRG